MFGRTKRLYVATRRLAEAIERPHDIYVAGLLVVHLYGSLFKLILHEDALRRLLMRGLFGLPTGRWVKVKELSRAIIPFLPFARKKRCLLLSVIAFRYLRREYTHGLTFVLGVRQDQPKQGARFHAWLKLDGERLLDTDAGVAYQPIFTFET